MKFFAIFTLLVLAELSFAQAQFDDAIGVAGKRMAMKIYGHDRTRIAVLNFVDHLGQPNELGALVAEELTVSLLEHSLGFEVMDRTHLEAVLEEHKLALGGLVNDSTLFRLGQLESVHVVVTGTITRMGEKYKATLKALDTESSMVIAADKEYFKSESYLDSYYGYENPPTPIAVVPPEPVGCYDGNYGSVCTYNPFAFPVVIYFDPQLSASTCKPGMSIEIPPRSSRCVDGICSGVLHYVCKDSYSGNELGKGSTYLKSCDEVRIEL